MDISGFSSLNAGTTENIPVQREALDSIPTLLQLRELYEEALREETAQAAAEEAADESPAEEAAPAAPASPAPAADIPTVEQLMTLRTREVQSQSRKQQSAARAAAYYDRRMPAPPPARRVAPVYRPKPAPAPAPKARPAAKPVVRAAVKPKVTEQPVRRPIAAEEPQPAGSLPTLTQLSRMRAELENAKREAGTQTGDVLPTFNNAADRFPSGSPSLAQLKKLREEVSRETYDKWEQIVPEQRMPAAPLHEIIKSTDDADALPTLAQLKSLLAEERRYGETPFQESVRQVKQTLHPTAPAAERPQQSAARPAPTPAPAPAARPAETDGRVRYIPYEDFAAEDKFEGFDRAAAAAAAEERFVAPDIPAAEPLNPKPAAEEDAPKTKREKKSKKKNKSSRSRTTTSRLPFLSSFLLRNS